MQQRVPVCVYVYVCECLFTALAVYNNVAVRQLNSIAITVKGIILQCVELHPDLSLSVFGPASSVLGCF